MAALCCKLALLPVERVFDDWMKEMNERVDDVMGRHVTHTMVDEGEGQHRRNEGSTSRMGERHEKENVMKCDGDNDQQQQQQQQQQQRREQRWHNRSLACQTGRKHITLVRLPLPHAGAHTH